MPRPIVTMRRALEDPNLLGTLLPGPSWRVWRALLIASRGEPLTDHELVLIRARTGRDVAPSRPVDELAIVSGRRSGKTAASATLAIYLSALVDWSDVVTRGGERGVLLFLAQSQRTAPDRLPLCTACVPGIAAPGAGGVRHDAGHHQPQPGD
jgi:hypothetical protein